MVASKHSITDNEQVWVDQIDDVMHSLRSAIPNVLEALKEIRKGKLTFEEFMEGSDWSELLSAVSRVDIMEEDMLQLSDEMSADNLEETHGYW